MKYLLVGVGVFMLPMLMLAPMLAMLMDPFAPWRFNGHTGQIAPGETGAPVPFVPVSIPAHGGVTDAYRYQLALAAGWTSAEAIIATAISIAEDGSGDPAALSGRNRNGTFDLGLWQINSAHWPTYGGQQALIDPANNARAGHAIYASAGWCSWSTYETSCGVGYTGTYRAFLTRAMTAAHASEPTLAIASTAPLFSQSLRSARRGYLTDYPGAPDRLVLWIDKGLAGVSLQRNCTLSQGVRSGVNVMAGYSTDDVTIEGQTIWLSAIGASAPPDEPTCEAQLDQWIDTRPCAERDGMCDIAALSQP